mmetsp:Transcript_9011/g.16633  ORF Transcript_9011/g.16633 Transcript_9011/m.16633 type:complete len:350 (-) Transcript_9011:1928-2977(-)
MGKGSAVIGILLAVMASCLNALGMNLQRLGQKPDAHEHMNTAGIALAAGAGILDMVSFGFAPQSLLAPLGAVTLIANLCLAPVLHQEKLAQVDIAATVLVCVGIAITLLSSSGDTPELTYFELQRLAKRPVFMVFLTGYITAIAGLISHIYVGERQGQGKSKLIGVGYPMLSGMLGGLTVLNAKIMTELLRLVSIRTHFAVIIPVIAMVLGCAISQTAVLNRGLGKHSSLFIIPLFSASMLIANLSAGGVFFNEFASYSKPQLGGFLVGVAIVVTGVTILATKDSAGPATDAKRHSASSTKSGKRQSSNSTTSINSSNSSRSKTPSLPAKHGSVQRVESMKSAKSRKDE